MENHLQKLTPAEFSDVTSKNPWRPALWESINDCYVRGRFDKQHDKQLCAPEIPVPDTTWSDISSELFTVLTMKAIAATTKALNEFILEICGPGSTHCEEIFSRSKSHLEQKYKNIIEVEIGGTLEKIREGLNRPFQNNGNGNEGYIVSSFDGESYNRIAHIQPGEDDVTIDNKSQFPKITSHSDSCQETTTKPQTTSAATTTSTTMYPGSTSKTDDSIGYIVGFSTTAAVILIFGVSFALWMKRISGELSRTQTSWDLRF